MKYSDLPVKSYNELSENTFIICSDIVTNENNEVESVNKIMMNATELANKNEIMTLAEQNAQLVKIVNQLVTKQQEMERLLNESNKRNAFPELQEIQNDIDLLKERLDNNIVEL